MENLKTFTTLKKRREKPRVQKKEFQGQTREGERRKIYRRGGGTLHLSTLPCLEQLSRGGRATFSWA